MCAEHRDVQQLGGGGLGSLDCLSLWRFVIEPSCSKPLRTPWTRKHTDSNTHLHALWLWHQATVSKADKTRLPVPLLTEEVNLLHLTSPLVLIIAWKISPDYRVGCRDLIWRNVDICGKAWWPTASLHIPGNPQLSDTLWKISAVETEWGIFSPLLTLKDFHYIYSLMFWYKILNRLLLYPDLADRSEIPAKMFHHSRGVSLKPKYGLLMLDFLKVLIKTV